MEDVGDVKWEWKDEEWLVREQPMQQGGVKGGNFLRKRENCSIKDFLDENLSSWFSLEKSWKYWRQYRFIQGGQYCNFNKPSTKKFFPVLVKYTDDYGLKRKRRSNFSVQELGSSFCEMIVHVTLEM